jgi:hypothetical protein
MDPAEAKELIRITNSQFKVWQENIRRETPLARLQGGRGATSAEKWKNPNYMYYWFILSIAYLEGGRVSRADIIGDRDAESSDSGAIDGVRPNTSRRYLGEVKALGLIERAGETDFQLTSAGRKVVEATLESWNEEFGKIFRRFHI